jgi:Tol biopolymer transport system component
VLSDRRHGSARRVPHPVATRGDLSEPALSSDGRVLAFSAVRSDGHSAVFVRDLRTQRTEQVSAPGQESYEPALSGDGRLVAFTTGEGVTRVVLSDRASGRTETLAPLPASDGLASGASAYEPSVSADGRRVAFSVRTPGRRTLVYVRDRRAAETELVSRVSGADGPPADGASTHPAISGDGRSVAFTSDAWNLSAGKCNSARGVFVRDLARHTTRLVSAGDGENRWLGPTKGSSSGDDALVAMLCA